MLTGSAVVVAAAGVAAWLLTYRESITVPGWGYPVVYVSPAWTTPAAAVALLAGFATVLALVLPRRIPSPR